ncbi:hypothetical protein M378DRAFT_421721 [Amanita muscaria Koide BX008]|uniref:Uncharacterized protein n=1 Tax=Amanita muscaria (strain Koide BX008) TaxID=946122 RepID=A0A0C2S387_AMAMK|nr:hypothetical protein M378DRAFT_421721 [Amanita muscaria Koide BX008]
MQSSYQFDGGPTEYFNLTLDPSQHFTDQAFVQPSATQSDGHHTLVITNLAGALTLDYFTIVPANSGSSPYQNIQKIDDASPNIVYNNAKPLSNTSQADFNGTLHSLSSGQSTASLNFDGNFVAVYGALPAGNSLPALSFTLDKQPIPTGQSEPSGSIPPLSASRKRLSQVLFWKSSILNDGQHNLLITAKQGEFLLDFILIQTSDGAGIEPTSSSQSLTPTTTYLASPSSTSASPYGSATSSSSASRSSLSGAPSDHTNTFVIIGGVVGGAVGFIVLLLAVYMIRIRYKRRSGLRSKTQSNTEPSSQPQVQAALPVTTPYLVGGSGQVVGVMGYLLGSSPMGPVPPPYQPRGETQERQVVPAEMNGGKDVQEVQYGHDDKFAAFGQVQTNCLV